MWDRDRSIHVLIQRHEQLSMRRCQSVKLWDRLLSNVTQRHSKIGHDLYRKRRRADKQAAATAASSKLIAGAIKSHSTPLRAVTRQRYLHLSKRDIISSYRHQIRSASRFRPLGGSSSHGHQIVGRYPF